MIVYLKKKKNQHIDKLNIITKPKIKTYTKKTWVVIWDLSLEFFDNRLLVGVEVKTLGFFFFLRKKTWVLVWDLSLEFFLFYFYNIILVWIEFNFWNLNDKVLPKLNYC